MIIFICVSVYLAIGLASCIVWIKMEPNSFDFENDTTFTDKIGTGLLFLLGLFWPVSWIALLMYTMIELLRILFAKIKDVK